MNAISNYASTSLKNNLVIFHHSGSNSNSAIHISIETEAVEKPEDVSDEVEEPAKPEDISNEVEKPAKIEEIFNEVEKPGKSKD